MSVAVYVAVTIVLLTALLRWLRNRPLKRCSLRSDGAVLLVTAHPDDECMFFAPTITAFTEAAVPVFLLCLSQGISRVTCATNCVSGAPNGFLTVLSHGM